MRYTRIDTISYEDTNGNIHAVKDIRNYPSYSKLNTVSLMDGDRLDEIASRPEYFGDDAEGDTYKIVDYNIVDLFENSFNLTNLKTLKIPLR